MVAPLHLHCRNRTRRWCRRHDTGCTNTVAENVGERLNFRLDFPILIHSQRRFFPILASPTPWPWIASRTSQLFSSLVPLRQPRFIRPTLNLQSSPPSPTVALMLFVLHWGWLVNAGKGLSFINFIEFFHPVARLLRRQGQG